MTRQSKIALISFVVALMAIAADGAFKVALNAFVPELVSITMGEVRNDESFDYTSYNAPCLPTGICEKTSTYSGANHSESQGRRGPRLLDFLARTASNCVPFSILPNNPISVGAAVTVPSEVGDILLSVCCLRL